MPFIYFSLDVYEILTANNLQPTEFKSVGIFKISLFVPEIEIKQFFYHDGWSSSMPIALQMTFFKDGPSLASFSLFTSIILYNW